MLFFIILGLAIAAIPVAMAWGGISAWVEARNDGRVPRGKRMRQAWAAAGVEWKGTQDPALPPPTPDQLRDLTAMEAYHMDHAVEMAVQQACERASSLFIRQGYTVEGARKEASRLEATPFAGIHGYTESKRIHERMDEMPVHLMLNAEAIAKLEVDSDALQAAWQSDGPEAAGKLAEDMGLGEDRTYKPLGWMDDDRKAVNRQLRAERHNRTSYKRDRSTPASREDGPEGWVSPEDARRAT